MVLFGPKSMGFFGLDGFYAIHLLFATHIRFSQKAIEKDEA